MAVWGVFDRFDIVLLGCLEFQKASRRRDVAITRALEEENLTCGNLKPRVCFIGQEFPY